MATATEDRAALTARQSQVKMVEPLPRRRHSRRGVSVGPGATAGRTRAAQPDAFVVLAVHDEIVVECDEDAMTPLLESVPVEVEVKVGKTWGG